MIPHEMNANKHPEKQIKMLAKLMNYQGWRHPIIVSKLSGKIVAGHGRLESAKLNGWSECPVDMQDFDDMAQELSFLASDNIIQDLAETDEDKLIELIRSTGIDDMELFGLDEFVLPPDDALAREEMEDEVPEVTESISKLGDLYEFGGHRLLCGDSTDKATVEMLMAGEKADMICTDPPYGMSLDTDYSKMGETTTVYKKVQGDDKPFNAAPIFSLFPNCKHFWLWGADYYSDTIPLYKDGNYVVWTKAHSEEENKVWTSRYELVWTYPKCKREVWFVRSISMLHGERTGEHPTQKPIELTERILKKREECNNIVDLFGGSGSTLIACEKTKRKCFMMELDPHYVDVIVTRWCKYTNSVNIKRNGEPMEWNIVTT